MGGKPAALILGMSETGLGAMRLLGRLGITCYAFDAIEPVPAFSSRYCRGRAVRLPPETSDDQVLRSLIDFAKNVLPPRPVLVPTSDRMVQLVSRSRAQLEPLFRMVLPDAETVEDILDKNRFGVRALASGATVPHGTTIDNIRYLPEAVSRLGLPLILKPFRQGDIAGTNFPKALLLQSAIDVAHARQRHAECTSLKLVAQEFIPGTDTQQFSVAACLDRDNNVLASFTARKVRQGTNGTGVGLYVESVHEPEAEQAALALLREMRVTGLAEVELKRHAETGRLYVIEINARVWLQVGLAAACGINFPALFYALAADLPLPRAEAGAGQQRRAAWQDLCHDGWAMFRPGGYRSKGDVSIFGWLAQSLRARSGPFISLRDPMPAIAWTCHLLRKLVPWGKHRTEHRPTCVPVAP